MKEFIIKQTKLNTFEIEYVSETEVTYQKIQEIKKAIIRYLENGLEFNFLRKEKLQRSKSGKLKQFVSVVKR